MTQLLHHQFVVDALIWSTPLQTKQILRNNEKQGIKTKLNVKRVSSGISEIVVAFAKIMLALISCVYSYPIKFCSTNCPLWYNKCWQGRDFLQLSMTPFQVTRINHYMNGRVTGHTNISGQKKKKEKDWRKNVGKLTCPDFKQWMY